MAPSESLRRARTLVPITALAVALVTLFGCVLIAKASGAYLSGMFWPFFSDTGRDKPAYFLFCAGLTTTALLLIPTYAFNYQFQRAVLRKAARAGEQTRWHQRLALATVVAGTLSVFGLSLLAFFDTAKYPATHKITAYWFFCWEAVATINNTFVSKRIYDLAAKVDAASASASNYIILEDTSKTNADAKRQCARKRHRLFRVQLTLNLVFFVAFLIYIPWQLAFPSHCPQLTVADCLSRDLGVEYCTVTMRKDAVDTILNNCEDKLTKVQLRALGQLTCILMLVGYCVTFVAHDYDDVDAEHETEERTLQPAVPMHLV